MTKIDETLKEKQKRIEKRNQYRNTVCCGCHYNYYNFPKDADNVGVAVDNDYSCWWIKEIKRNACRMKQ